MKLSNSYIGLPEEFYQIVNPTPVKSPSMLVFNEELANKLNIEIPNKDEAKAKNKIIDWQLALQRAGKKEALAKDMLVGLIKSLPETKQSISEALTCQDVEQVKTLVHKLNGACCYSGVPNLGKVVHELETQLKKGQSLDDLEPEFFEFFEHIEQVIDYAPEVLDTISI